MKASKIILPILLVLLLVIAGGIYYSNSKKTTEEVVMTESPAATVLPEASPVDMSTMSATQTGASTSGTVAAQQIAVTASNYAFSPKTIRVKKGQPVTITLKSTVGIHDFMIDGLNVKTKTLNPGQSETVTFTPTKAGTFEFYCSVGNHRAMGMVGSLIVE